jgi:adenylate cyclase
LRRAAAPAHNLIVVALQAGARIGVYELAEKLGQGGMGEVWRAVDTRLGRDVALKLLPDAFSGDPGRLARFKREARVLATLHHPNIAVVFEAGESEHGHFIAMELVRGQTLRSWLGKELDLPWLVSVGRQLGDALASAHAAGVVHRDIKPDNVMIRDDGFAKVLDFGLARTTQDTLPTADATTTVLTGTHTIVGTMKYMSPEQVEAAPAGPASDVFSLGIVLYELATGTHPFDAPSRFGILDGIVSQQPTPPSRLSPELGGSLEAVLLDMLEKDPHRRPDAASVAARLSAAGTSTTGETLAVSRPLASRGTLVGRERASHELRAALGHVSSGRGLLLGVSGEAGIGKSTVVDDLLSDAGVRAQYQVGHGRCSERLAGTEAYLPLFDGLADLLRGHDGSTARLLKTTAPLWFRQVSPSVRDTSVGDAPGATQERLKRELVTFLAEASRQRPIVFYFDDVHWADVATIDVVNYVARHFDSLPVLFIVTYRPEELLRQRHAFLATKRDLQGRGLCREIVLDFLEREHVRDYVAARFPRHDLPPEIGDLIHRRTEGNPLFVVNLIEYLIERGFLRDESGTWRLTRSLDDIASDLPESVRGMIQRKIDLLGEAERRLLTTASVQGTEFDGAVAATVLRLDPVDVEEQLDTLERSHGFIQRIREQVLPDGTLTLRYRFVHVLYQNALYASLRPVRRTALNRDVAAALESFHGPRAGEIAAELAVLYEGAREFAKAVDHFQRAAEKATRIFAYDEVLAISRRALGLLRSLPDTPGRRRRELTVLMTMLLPARARQGFANPEVRDVYDLAAERCQEFGMTDELVRVLWSHVTFNVVSLQLESADVNIQGLATVAREAGSASAGLHAVYGSGIVHYYRGSFAAATRAFERVAGMGGTARVRDLLPTIGYDPSAPYYLGWSLWHQGFPDRAVGEAEAALRAAERAAHPVWLVEGLTFATTVLGWCGHWDRARAYNDRALEIARERGFTYLSAVAQCFEGMRLARAGHPDALARIDEGFDTLLSIGGRASIQRFVGELALARARAGRAGEGILMLDEHLGSAGSALFGKAELLRLRGELLLGSGDAAGAEACFRQALGVARQQEARSLELRAATGLARLWHTQERTEDASSLLTGVYGVFTEGFETEDLRHAREVLAQLAASP